MELNLAVKVPEGGSARVLVNGKKVTLQDGEATIKTASGATLAFYVIIIGAPGDAYAVTWEGAPSNKNAVSWKASGTLDRTGTYQAADWLEVP